MMDTVACIVHCTLCIVFMMECNWWIV